MFMARRINWNGPDVTRAIILAGMGIKNDAITGQTGLSAGQIRYRLRELGLENIRDDYRNGQSLVAKRAIKAVSGYISQYAATRIRNHIADDLSATNGTHSPKRL